MHLRPELEALGVTKEHLRLLHKHISLVPPRDNVSVTLDPPPFGSDWELKFQASRDGFKFETLFHYLNRYLAARGLVVVRSPGGSIYGIFYCSPTPALQPYHQGWSGEHADPFGFFFSLSSPSNHPPAIYGAGIFYVNQSYYFGPARMQLGQDLKPSAIPQIKDGVPAAESTDVAEVLYYIV